MIDLISVEWTCYCSIDSSMSINPQPDANCPHTRSQGVRCHGSVTAVPEQYDDDDERSHRETVPKTRYGSSRSGERLMQSRAARNASPVPYENVDLDVDGPTTEEPAADLNSQLEQFDFRSDGAASLAVSDGFSLRTDDTISSTPDESVSSQASILYGTLL